LGGSIANWSFVAFVGMGVLALVTVLGMLRMQSIAAQLGSDA
jgi:hypothetical protein